MPAAGGRPGGLLPGWLVLALSGTLAWLLPPRVTLLCPPLCHCEEDGVALSADCSEGALGSVPAGLGPFTAYLELELVTVMSLSAGFQFSLNFLQAKNVLSKLTGLCCMLLFTLCLFADQENGGRVLASLPGNWNKADVKFDSNTAIKSLVVSSDKKTVENGGVPQVVPDNLERFNSSPCVLGSPGFRSGKHFVEVKYGTQREWAVGLAGKSVRRKSYLRLAPEEQSGLWWLRQLEPQKSSGDIILLLYYNEGKFIFNLTGGVIITVIT